jgi:recombination protein RecA
MTTPSPKFQAALTSLQERLGGAAPRWGGEVLGALAMAPRPIPAGDSEGLAGLSAGLPGDLPVASDRATPTGFRALDAILGLGGLPRAATTSLHGDGTSGKTTLALQAVAQAQVAGGIVAYLDIARSLDPVEAVARGVELDWLVVLTPGSLEEALSMAAMLLQDRTVDLLLLDLPYRPLEGAAISAANMAERFNRLAALARRAGVQMLVLEPPSLPSALAGALSQVASLRLELSRRAWIRLGRDVVGQRTEVRVTRDRFAPPGRAAELRILYAEGGLRDACLARSELLRDGPAGLGLVSIGGRLGAGSSVGVGTRVAAAPRAGAVPRAGAGSSAAVGSRGGAAPPGGSGPSALASAARPSPPLHSTAKPVSNDETSPSPLAPPSPQTGSQQVLRAIRGGADRSGWPAVDGRSGTGREPVGIGAGRPAGDAARGGA